MTESDARKIALEFLRGRQGSTGMEVVIVDEYTIEKDYGFVFCYNTKKFIESGMKDIRYALGGNAPLLIERATGNVIVTGTARSIEFYLENYEKTGQVDPRDD